MCNITCSVLFCSVRTSSLADIQALVFLLIHSQNVNWITRAQINPRREKMQISFYINQFHLWNNSMFLERICFFFFFILYTCLYLYIYFLLQMDSIILWLLINNQSVIPSTDVTQLTLTLKMTTAQVVETSVTVNNSPIQDYVHPDDQTQPFEIIIVMRIEFRLQ